MQFEHLCQWIFIKISINFVQDAVNTILLFFSFVSITTKHKIYILKKD